jgi:hypothetical protein
MKKSELYAEYAFALKFFNRERVAYPLYFEYRAYDDGRNVRFALPVGRIESDLGPVFNDFCYLDSPCDTQESDTDLSTSRAYRVLFDTESGAESVVCVTHESGLEIFCMATAALIGTETGKYLLKRILERSEQRINEWMKKKNKSLNKNDPDPVVAGPIVERIALRTPDWEITLDGRFSPPERDALIERILLQADRTFMEDCLHGLSDDQLARKALSATRPVGKGRAP